MGRGQQAAEIPQEQARQAAEERPSFSGALESLQRQPDGGFALGDGHGHRQQGQEEQAHRQDAAQGRAQIAVLGPVPVEQERQEHQAGDVRQQGEGQHRVEEKRPNAASRFQLAQVAQTGDQGPHQGQGVVEGRYPVHGLKVRHVEQEEQTPGQTQLQAQTQPAGQQRQQQAGQRVSGDRGQVVDDRVVACGQEDQVLGQFGDRPAGFEFLVGGEEEGEVLVDGQVVAEGLVVVDIEEQTRQAGEANGGE